MEIGSTPAPFGLAAFLLAVWDTTSVFVVFYICDLTYRAFALLLMPADADFALTGLRTAILAVVANLLVVRLAPASLRRAALRPSPADIAPLVGLVWMQTGLVVIAYTGIAHAMRTPLDLPASFLAAWMTGTAVAFAAGRLWLRPFAKTAYSRFLRSRNVGIIGDPPAVDSLACHLRRVNGPDVTIVSRCDDAQPDWGVDRMVGYGQRGRLDQAILAGPVDDAGRVDTVVAKLKALNAEVLYYQPGPGIPVVLAPRPISPSGLKLKSGADILLSILLIIWLLPLLGLIAAAIKLDSPGPVFFRQKRHGLNNVEFDILKFRTMTWGGEEKANGARQTRRNDPRVTRTGGFLRRSSLDELPQLFNVLRGEMSLVGPRPHPVAMLTANRSNTELVEDYSHRHRVKPGLTGWAQINGHRGATTTAEQIRQRVEHDLFYIDNWSFFLDLKILLLTPLRLITDRDGAF